MNKKQINMNKKQINVSTSEIIMFTLNIILGLYTALMTFFFAYGCLLYGMLDLITIAFCIVGLLCCLTCVLNLMAILNSE